jgi:predicted LPLAT superfamily acyltransferase
MRPPVASEPVASGGGAAPGAAEWLARGERGTMAMLRLMTVISLHLGRRVARLVVYGIAAYFFLFAPTARRHACAYLGRALGRPPTAADRFRHIFSFAATIHDRIYLISDRFDLFSISVEGEALVREAIENRRGAILMGAHFGSFEVTRALGRSQSGLRVVMAMYAENARKISSTLTAINPTATLDVVALGHLDAMLRLRADLDAGACVGVLGDRAPGAGATEAVQFLGATAHLPTGPMRAAATLGRPVVFMAGIYRGGNRYHIVFERLADFSATSPAERPAAIRAAISRYVGLLEQHCRRDPYNWFNFFDFWAEPRPAPPATTS